LEDSPPKIQIMKLAAVYLASLFTQSYLWGDTSPLITVKYARTKEQIQWGMMQYRSLSENEGMLFHFDKPKLTNMWAFNCFLDLSVAFIDDQKKVCSIQDLRAFPERMDSSRLVLSVKDFSLYSEKDPIVVFFRKNSVNSYIPVLYALEMNRGWFKKNEVQVGDILEWSEDRDRIFFVRGNHAQSNIPPSLE
jgi:uncharacterized membrane protein (UPF0127 family)